jgi:hypothetical protein
LETEEWKDFMPELSEWFGVPLMLAKSLYGNQVANLAWDETQEELGPLRGGRLSLLFARSKERPKRKTQQRK